MAEAFSRRSRMENHHNHRRATIRGCSLRHGAVELQAFAGVKPRPAGRPPAAALSRAGPPPPARRGGCQEFDGEDRRSVQSAGGSTLGRFPEADDRAGKRGARAGAPGRVARQRSDAPRPRAALPGGEAALAGERGPGPFSPPRRRGSRRGSGAEAFGPAPTGPQRQRRAPGLNFFCRHATLP
jgi:hypothetical protein